MVSKSRITAIWDIFPHPDYPASIVGCEPHKPASQYARSWVLARKNIRLILVSDSEDVTQGEAIAFARMLMDGKMIGKKVGMEK